MRDVVLGRLPNIHTFVISGCHNRHFSPATFISIYRTWIITYGEIDVSMGC